MSLVTLLVCDDAAVEPFLCGGFGGGGIEWAAHGEDDVALVGHAAPGAPPASAPRWMTQHLAPIGLALAGLEDAGLVDLDDAPQAAYPDVMRRAEAAVPPAKRDAARDVQPFGRLGDARAAATSTQPETIGQEARRLLDEAMGRVNVSARDRERLSKMFSTAPSLYKVWAVAESQGQPSVRYEGMALIRQGGRSGGGNSNQVQRSSAFLSWTRIEEP